MRVEKLSVLCNGLLILLTFSLVYSSGCVQIPVHSEEKPGNLQEQPFTEPIQPKDHLMNVNNSSTVSPLSPPEEFPSALPPPATSDIQDWNPYNVLPPPEPVLNHSSILRNDTPHYRKKLNTTYSGSVGLAGYAIGKDLNIISGPFSIVYTVHPNISSPRDVWVKLTVFDPWQQVIAMGGYNRGYPNQETQTMTIYCEGRYYLTIEGDFASVDYSIKTGDPVSVSMQAQIPISSEEIPDEEMMRKMRGL